MRTSPLCTRVSPKNNTFQWFDEISFLNQLNIPGGAWVVLNFSDNALEFESVRWLLKTWKKYKKLFLYSYLKHPGLAPSKAEHDSNKFRFKCKQMSAWRHSGKPFSTEFMSIPFVYVHACWKYSSSRCRNGFGI